MIHSNPTLNPSTHEPNDNMVFELVVKGISAQLKSDRIIKAEDLIREELGLSSMKLVMFFTDITTQLDISIMDFADYELLRLKTVGDIAELLNSKL